MNPIKHISEMMAEIDAPSAILKNEHPGFLLSLMIIASYVIQTDGKIMHSELEFLRGFLEDNYGFEKKEKYIGILLNLFEESKKYSSDEWMAKIKVCSQELSDYTTDEQKMLLVSFMSKIVKADKKVEYSEVKTLLDISEWLRVDLTASERINNLNIEEVWTWM